MFGASSPRSRNLDIKSRSNPVRTPRDRYFHGSWSCRPAAPRDHENAVGPGYAGGDARALDRRSFVCGASSPQWQFDPDSATNPRLSPPHRGSTQGRLFDSNVVLRGGASWPAIESTVAQLTYPQFQRAVGKWGLCAQSDIVFRAAGNVLCQLSLIMQ